MKNLLLIVFAIAIGQSALAFEMPLDTNIYDMPERMPEFPGGPDAMHHYINDHLTYPEEAKEKKIQGKVYIQFVVEKDGSISQVKVRRGVHKLLDKEAKRVIESMPNWKPGSMRGKIIRVRHTIPIVFALP